jgi:hypothetical protein
MNYKEKQRDKAIALLGEMFNDPGGGRYVNDLNFIYKELCNIYAAFFVNMI